MSVQGCAHRDTATPTEPGMCRKVLSRLSSPQFCPTSNLGLFSILQKQENVTHCQGAQLEGAPTGSVPTQQSSSSSHAKPPVPVVTLKDLGDVSVGDSPDTPPHSAVAAAAARAHPEQLLAAGVQRGSQLVPVNLNLSQVSGRAP